MTIRDRITKSLSDFLFFQVDIVSDLEFESNIYKDVKQKNNDSIINPGNWDLLKEKFFVQRMATYKDSYCLAEKIKLELGTLEILPINETDYQILKDRYTQYLGQQKALLAQQNTKRKPELNETPNTFEKLFYNTELVEPCIDILKELDPQLVDTDCNYMGKLKGGICVWIDEMQRQGIIKSNYPKQRELFSLLIPQKIKRFSIDESMFGKHHSKAEKNYRSDIKTMLSKIKLSQNSQ